MSENVDGRRAKGERRRRALIDATLRVIEHEGTAAVSHRRIAREAGVPAASIGYYFDSIDDLLVATLLDSVETMVEDIERLREATPVDGWSRALAGLIAAMINEQRGRTIAEYELCLMAARRPRLRPAARRWREVAEEYVDSGDEPPDPGVLKALFAAFDGFLLQGLVADTPPTPAELEPAMHFLVQPAQYLKRIGAGPDPA